MILTKFDTFLKDFHKSSPISNLSKIPLVADAPIHTDRWMDGQDEGNRAFRECTKVRLKVKFASRKTGGSSSNMGVAVKC